MGNFFKNSRKLFSGAGSLDVINPSTQTALNLKVNKAGDTLSGPVNANQGANIASATSTPIGAATGEYVHITGTTTITSFDTIQAGTERTVVFDGILTLTHNTTSLILPGAVNILTAVGDTAIFRSEGSGNWRCINYSSINSSNSVGSKLYLFKNFK